MSNQLKGHTRDLGAKRGSRDVDFERLGGFFNRKPWPNQKCKMRRHLIINKGLKESGNQA